MSIIIKGMDMPKENGVKCICIFPDGKVSNTYDSDRKQIATAFQLSPHGRLIDAEALKADLEYWESIKSNHVAKDTKQYCIAFVRASPTVIESTMGHVKEEE